MLMREVWSDCMEDTGSEAGLRVLGSQLVSPRLDSQSIVEERRQTTRGTQIPDRMSPDSGSITSGSGVRTIP